MNRMPTILKQYLFIRDYIKSHGYAPSQREIQMYMKQKSSSSTNYHIKKMFEIGWLETDIKDNVLHPRAYRLGKSPFVKEDTE